MKILLISLIFIFSFSSIVTAQSKECIETPYKDLNERRQIIQECQDNRYILLHDNADHLIWETEQSYNERLSEQPIDKITELELKIIELENRIKDLEDGHNFSD